MEKAELSLPHYQDYISPTIGVIKWQLYIGFILEISRCEVRIDDMVMYLPAAVAVIDNVLDKESNPKIALHAILAFVHNMRGHRFLPYIDPKTGYHCKIAPTEDVVYHAFMLGFVDYAVSNKFPSELLNTAYKHLSKLMKLGIAYSLYVSYNFGSDPEACNNFVPSLATSSVPAGTMFSLLAMWNFPFDYPEKYSSNQLVAYSYVMYAVSFSTALLLVYEFKDGNKFEEISAGKLFESFFIAGASLKGLEIISDYFQEKYSQFVNITRESTARFIGHYTSGVKNFLSAAANKFGFFSRQDSSEYSEKEMKGSLPNPTDGLVHRHS